MDEFEKKAAEILFSGNVWDVKQFTLQLASILREQHEKLIKVEAERDSLKEQLEKSKNDNSWVTDLA